jgi:hypothetical protein
VSPATPRPWQTAADLPNGHEWHGADPWTATRQRPNLEGELRKLEQHGQRLDWAIRIATVRDYGERMAEYRRLHRLGVRSSPPLHYSKTAVYRAACRRLAAKPTSTTTTRRAPAADDHTSPRTIVRNLGHVIGVR